MNYTELINRIEELKSRKGRGSISADETFSLLMELAEKTKAVDINAGSLTIRHLYTSVSAMNADNNPVDQETGKPLKFGQLVCVCDSNNLAQADNGKVYRYNKPGWEFLRQVGDMAQFAKTEEVNNNIVQIGRELSVLINIPIVFDSAGYYSPTNPTKVFTESTTYSSMSLPVKKGDAFICSFRLGGGSMAGIIFYDSVGNNKGHQSIGDSQDHVNVSIVVPDNVTEMIYASDKNFTNNKIKKLSKDIDGELKKVENDLASTSQNLGSIQGVAEEIKENPIEINIDVIPNIERSYQKYDASKANGVIQNPDYNIMYLDVTQGQKYKVTGKAGGSSMAMIVFFDNDGNNKGYLYRGSSSNPSYQDVTFEIQREVTEMSFCVSRSNDHEKKIALSTYDYATPIKQLKEEIVGLYDVKAQVTELLEIKDKTVIYGSKNKYDGGKINGYINTLGLLISSTDPHTWVTMPLRLKPNTFYSISNRKMPNASQIRCLDESLLNPVKVLIAETGEEYSSWYTPNPTGTGMATNGNTIFLTPPNVSYIQFNISFQKEIADYDKVMLEEIGNEYDRAFVPSPYQPYTVEAKIKKEALPDDIQGENMEETININTVPVFLLSGASHGEGYGSVKDKAFISYLSHFMNWNVENYSLSGSDNVEHFNHVASGRMFANVHPSNLPGGYVLIILGGNEEAYRSHGIDAKYFRQNIIRLSSAYSALGYKVIIGSYYGDMSTPWSLVCRDVAMEYGYLYLDINGFSSRFYRTCYEPWWYSGHYATRTNVMQWHNYMKLLKDIENPETGLKIFRNRIDVASIDDLLFDNMFEKMKCWRELTISHCPLTPETQNYVDRLDLPGKQVARIPSEYQGNRTKSLII